jgi:hypothetical protein
MAAAVEIRVNKIKYLNIVIEFCLSSYLLLADTVPDI